MINKKLCVHSWHDRLISFANYDERVVEIKENKPEHEQEIRLRVFKRLNKKAIKALPKKLIKADADWEKTYVDWKKTNADWEKTDADWEKTDADWEKANADWKKAYVDWDKTDADWEKTDADWKGKEEWHKKYCGCKEWNGKELVFD